MEETYEQSASSSGSGNGCKGDNILNTIVTLVLSALVLINIVAYIATLVKVQRGSKYRFIT